MAIDQLAEIQSQMCIKGLEALHDLFCLKMTGGKNNSLTQFVTAVDLQTVFHQVIQHSIDGAKVNILAAADGFCIDHSASIAGRCVILITGGKGVLKLFLFRICQFIIVQTTAQSIGGLVQHRETNQISFFDGFFQLIGKVRLAVGQFKHLISTLVVLSAGRCGEADHQRIKIVEQSAVLLEYGAVRLIDNNQIETTDTEFTGIVVDQVDHSLIGRENNAGVGIPIQTAAGIYRSGHTGQQLGKVLVSLPHQ